MLRWLKSLFGGAPRRDISRLGPETGNEALDTLTEVVDLKGGPLKPLHRRLALRDRRLLPKPPAPPIRLGKRPKHPWFSPRDAARWLAGRRMLNTTAATPTSSAMTTMLVMMSPPRVSLRRRPRKERFERTI